MSFDWPDFLRQHNIEFVKKGPNTPRGEISVRCPLCGPEDPSNHLCISLKGKGWHCWRNALHKGKDRARLISLLLKCDMATARELAGYTVQALPSNQEMTAKWAAWNEAQNSTPFKASPPSLALLKEFRTLRKPNIFATQFMDYLRGRGYRKEQLKWLIDAYDLHYTTRGPFSYRIIIPVKDPRGQLLTWTGRTVVDDEIRYKTLSTTANARQGLPAAATSTSQTLLGLDLLWKCYSPKALFICEGPFDAMWITTFGRAVGVYATCLFGLNLSPAQSGLLIDLQTRFPRQRLLLDSAAKYQAFRMAQSGLGLGVETLPNTIKDPAELTPDAVVDFCLSMVE